MESLGFVRMNMYKCAATITMKWNDFLWCSHALKPIQRKSIELLKVRMRKRRRMKRLAHIFYLHQRHHSPPSNKSYENLFTFAFRSSLFALCYSLCVFVAYLPRKVFHGRGVGIHTECSCVVCCLDEKRWIASAEWTVLCRSVLSLNESVRFLFRSFSCDLLTRKIVLIET